MIKCRCCGGDARTIYSIREGEDVIRRRECTVCGCRFVTREAFVRETRSVKNWKQKGANPDGETT